MIKHESMLKLYYLKSSITLFQEEQTLSNVTPCVSSLTLLAERDFPSSKSKNFWMDKEYKTEKSKCEKLQQVYNNNKSNYQNLTIKYDNEELIKLLVTSL